MSSETKNQIEELEKKLTGDMLKDMNIRDEIHKLEIKKNKCYGRKKERPE